MCDFCEKKSILESNYCDLKIQYDVPLFGETLTAFNLKKGCPPFAECSSRDTNNAVHFKIRFCPMCGKNLVEQDKSLKEKEDYRKNSTKCFGDCEHLNEDYVGNWNFEFTCKKRNAKVKPWLDECPYKLKK